VLSVQVYESSGTASLDKAALEAVLAARFQPARQDGKPVSIRAIIPVTFRLQ
jgi:periplasmic protein TonB